MDKRDIYIEFFALTNLKTRGMCWGVAHFTPLENDDRNRGQELAALAREWFDALWNRRVSGVNLTMKQ